MSFNRRRVHDTIELQKISAIETRSLSLKEHPDEMARGIMRLLNPVFYQCTGQDCPSQCGDGIMSVSESYPENFQPA